jgi:signal transduction histidine kinase/CheY-like chemotaxis protein
MEPAVRENVRVEQMRMLFETALPGMLLATAFAVALSWQMRGTIDDRALTAWVVAKCVVVLPRVAHALAFARRRSDALAWLRWGVGLMTLDALVWGAAGVVLMMPGDRSAMTVIAASLAGVSAVAAFALYAYWWASAIFSVSMLGPMIGYFVSRADAFGWYGAASIGVFMVLLLAAARRSERHFVELLTLRFNNARLTEQLSASLARTEQESRAKDVFVANMSHELRTPLHGILGLSRALARNVAPDQRETVALIRRSGEHLLAIINNILEFSRFKAHGIDLHPTEVDIVRVIEDAVALCMPTAKESGLTLSTEVWVEVPYVAFVDPLRLRQIVLNLVGNAIKFTERGGSVHVQIGQSSGGGLRISVVDTGVGIGPEAMAQLFEPFRQGDASASRQRGGTGLGLHITREICRALGGDVTCRSKPGIGSSFDVVLPLQRETESSLALARPGSDSEFLVEDFGGATVLLAEDNEVNALVALAALARLGLSVEHVASGREVVQRLCTAGLRPDIVLLDCQMPGMDGFEACRRVRAYEREQRLDRVPIVALTANVFQQDREKCREAGMDGFLGKPFTEAELRQVLALYARGAARDDLQPAAVAAGYAARL